MNIVKSLKLKVFDINAHALRGRNFYKSIVDYRSSILPSHIHRIKNNKEFSCVLCGSSHGTNFLEWVEGYTLFECASCNAVSPNIKITDESKHIDSIYDVDEYRAKFMRETHQQFEYRKNNFGKERYKYTVERLKLPDSAKVLDLGCGAGYYISVLAENNVRYKGLEVAKHFVEYCKTYHQLNVDNSSLEEEADNQYDLITMFDVLEHLADPVTVFNTLNNKLKPGGYCVAYTPNIRSIGYELMGAKQNTLLPFEHLCFFDKKSLDYLAKMTGFEVELVETFGLDIMDYLLMKEYEDDFNYTGNLSEMTKLLQSLLDKFNLSNHFRITFKKK
jgi:2-polyprenyl-3-methyl-5-hydroxy-6-metoxy-1,4-benzoquinol methylase